MNNESPPSANVLVSVLRNMARVVVIWLGLVALLVVSFVIVGWRTSDSIGQALFNVGLGLTVISALVNFNRSGNSLKQVEPYEKWQARKVDTVSDWAMLVLVASICLVITGYLVLHWAACGRLYCG